MIDTKISIEALAAAIRKYAIPKKTYVDYAVKMKEEQAKLRIVSGLTVGEITELLLAGYELRKPPEPPQALEQLFRPWKRLVTGIKYFVTGRWQ